MSTDESEKAVPANKTSQGTVGVNRPPLAQLTDRHGNTFYFGDAGDYWHPPFPVGADTDYCRHVAAIENFEVRPDDVFICSYPKTGLHWTMEMVSMLKKNQIQYVDDGQMRGGFIDSRPVDSVDGLPSPRILSTHVPFRHLPKQLFQKRAKVIILDRNPKDVLVSYYNHLHVRHPPGGYPGTFKQFFDLYFEVGYYYGHFFDYMLEWQAGLAAHPELDVFLCVFEDSIQDPAGRVKKLNDFLGTGCSEELCEEITEACNFKNLKEFKDRNTPASLRATFRTSDASTYRKGEVGDWKNWFTVAMNEKFDQEFRLRMKDYKTQYKFNLS